jgi:hypothetical protein
VAIPADFAQGDYVADSVFRGRFHRWLAGIWAAKDAEIDALMPPQAAPSDTAAAKT